MRILYSDIIENFKDILHTPKEFIEETFNKPDAIDIIANKYISIKYFSDFFMLVVFEMDDKTVKFLNAYTVPIKLMDGVQIEKMKPVKVLEEFMNKYGVETQVPKVGKQKFFIKKELGICFLGILDIDKYLEALKNV